METPKLDVTWKKCTMREALEHARERKLSDDFIAGRAWLGLGPEYDWVECGVAKFTDGTVVACRSVWKNPWSEVTPDIDAVPPDWFIGTPKETE